MWETSGSVRIQPFEFWRLIAQRVEERGRVGEPDRADPEGGRTGGQHDRGEPDQARDSEEQPRSVLDRRLPEEPGEHRRLGPGHGRPPQARLSALLRVHFGSHVRQDVRKEQGQWEVRR